MPKKITNPKITSGTIDILLVNKLMRKLNKNNLKAALQNVKTAKK